MSSQKDSFTHFLQLLNANNCLQYVIVIGSWAEFLYQECSLLYRFEASLKTMDIDFLVSNQRKPNPPKDIIKIAHDAGYLFESDRLSGATKIYDKNDLEIELLLGKAGAGLETTLKTNLGVTAQTLWHTDILKRFTRIANYADMNVLVPLPEAYTIHKIVINKQRGNKAAKDAYSIKHILPYLDST